MICRAGGAQGRVWDGVGELGIVVGDGKFGMVDSTSPPRKDQGSCAAPTARQQQERLGFSPITENSSKICGLDLPGTEHTTLNILV